MYKVNITLTYTCAKLHYCRFHSYREKCPRFDKIDVSKRVLYNPLKNFTA